MIKADWQLNYRKREKKKTILACTSKKNVLTLGIWDSLGWGVLGIGHE